VACKLRLAGLVCADVHDLPLGMLNARQMVVRLTATPFRSREAGLFANPSSANSHKERGHMMRIGNENNQVS
jgi:hypothetical protein